MAMLCKAMSCCMTRATVTSRAQRVSACRWWVLKDRAQDVKHIVDKLKQAGRAEAELHKRVYRPWGWYEQRGHGSRFQVKLPIPAHPANRSGNIRRFISEYPAK